MESEECLRFLLDSEASLEGKADYFVGYVRWYEACGRNVGVSVRGSREFALQELSKPVQPDAQGKRKELEDVLRQIFDLLKRRHVEHDSQTEMKMNKLRSLPPGMLIMIDDSGSKDIVRLLEVNRSRFTYEYAYGRRFSLHGSLFLYVHQGDSPAFLF